MKFFRKLRDVYTKKMLVLFMINIGEIIRNFSKNFK